MVCVPCFIIPVLLFIWHRFIQPIVLRYWNPFQVKDAEGNVVKSGKEFPFQCAGGQCPFPAGQKKQELDAAAADNSTGAAETTAAEARPLLTNKKDE